MEPMESRRRRVLSDSEKRAYVVRQTESGKTIAAFCRDEDIALSSFQSWIRKFAEKPAFIEIVAPIQPCHVPVELVLASGDKISTSSDCDPTCLAKLARSLGTAQC